MTSHKEKEALEDAVTAADIPLKKCPSQTSDDEGSEATPQRDAWSRHAEFMLSLIGYAVGLGNIWRFPFLCMRNGGGAFLIPYFLALFIVGMPLFFLEVLIGQFSHMSTMQVWCISPLFKGIGYGMLILPTICSIYYNVIIAWILFYLVKSFTTSLPWYGCDNHWNTPLCLIRQGGGSVPGINMTNSSDPGYSMDGMNGSGVMSVEDRILAARRYANLAENDTIYWTSPTEEFWQYETLDLTPGIHDLGGMKWDLLGCLVLAWIIVFLCLIKGIKSSGKVVYVTATAPYILLGILLVRGCMLPGAVDGIKYYIIPDWQKLLSLNVWAEACMQIFYTLGPAWGSLITMSSYNKFNNNCQRDSIILPLVTCLSSFYGGFVIFSVIGFMARQAGLSVSDVVTSGPGLVFIAYPEALSHLPIAPMWAIMFFLMLFTVGMGSQFVMIETISSSVVDMFPRQLRKRKTLVTAAVCVALLLLGVPMVTKGGMYIFQIVDWYCAFGVMFLALVELIVLCWIYGTERLFYDAELMLGKKPLFMWKIFWKFITPTIVLLMIVYSLVGMKPPVYGDYTYPPAALAFGWCIALLPFIPVPIMAAMELHSRKGSILQRLKQSVLPGADWGPSDPEVRETYKYQRGPSQALGLLRGCGGGKARPEGSTDGRV